MVADLRSLLGASTYVSAERHVPVARRWVRDLVSGHVDEETLCDVAVCAGELADNARKHGPPGGEFSVAVYLADDVVLIQVTNAAAGVTLPHVTNNRFTEEGHGLQIVSGLAKDWGVDPTDDSRRIVWCAFPRNDADVTAASGNARRGDQKGG
jgi:serine/threonine-protein kinase RsbW